MSATSKGNRYGARGGNWLPELVGGQAPFGSIDGQRQDCPEPVLVQCSFCGWRFWVTPADANKPCHVCNEKVLSVEIPRRSA